MINNNHDITFRLGAYEGPFDLLLELIRDCKINLCDVSLSRITDDFLRYVDEHELSTSMQADFVVFAATMVLLKLRRLLSIMDDKDEVEITELTERLRVYEQYRRQTKLIR